MTIKYCYTLRKFYTDYAAFVTISKISHLAIIALIVANVNTVKNIILIYMFAHNFDCKNYHLCWYKNCDFILIELNFSQKSRVNMLSFCFITNRYLYLSMINRKVKSLINVNKSSIFSVPSVYHFHMIFANRQPALI